MAVELQLGLALPLAINRLPLLDLNTSSSYSDDGESDASAKLFRSPMMKKRSFEDSSESASASATLQLKRFVLLFRKGYVSSIQSSICFGSRFRDGPPGSQKTPNQEAPIPKEPQNQPDEFSLECLSQMFSNRYAHDEEAAEDHEETRWKYIHGDVFRYPKYKSLLAEALGSGFQLFTVTIFIFLLALVGVFYPYNRGALFTALVVIYALTSGIASYTSTS